MGTEEELSAEQMRDMHKKIDKDNNGKISLNEIMKFNTEARSSIATKETASLFDGMDNDKDGKISMDELIEGTFGAPLPDEVELPASKDPEQIEEDAKNARDKVREEKKFHAADKNHDGFLDKDELVHVFYPETHPDVMSVSSAEEL